MPGRFPHHRLQMKPVFSNPGMHRDTCVTHVPWCMSGSLTREGGENDPGIPGACATHNFAYLVKGPWLGTYTFQWHFNKKHKNNPCTNMHLKMSSTKWRPFRSDSNMLSAVGSLCRIHFWCREMWYQYPDTFQIIFIRDLLHGIVYLIPIFTINL